MIVGQPGTGKSLWALRQLQQISLKHPVLLIAAEAQGGLTDRITALEMATGQLFPPQYKIYDQPINLRYEDDVTMLAAFAREMQARVICFDTWAACTAGADENSVREVQPIFTVLDYLKAEVGCSILLVHHTRKDGGVYRGSSAILGSLDNLYMLTADDGELTLRPEKTRDQSKPYPRHYRIVEFETRRYEDTGEPVLAPALVPSHEAGDSDPAQEAVTGNKRKILEALDAYEDGVTAVRLQEMTGANNSAFYRSLERLVDEGYVTKPDNRRAPYTITEAGQQAIR